MPLVFAFQIAPCIYRYHLLRVSLDWDLGWGIWTGEIGMGFGLGGGLDWDLDWEGEMGPADVPVCFVRKFHILIGTSKRPRLLRS